MLVRHVALANPCSALPALRSTSHGHPARSGSNVRLEPIDAAVVGSQADAASDRMRPAALTRRRSLPHTAVDAIERMRRFSKESAAAEEQQGRQTSKKASGDMPHRRASVETCGEYRRRSKQGPGGHRRGSKEGQLRRAGMLSVSGKLGIQQENLAPGALGKGQEDDRLASHRSSSSGHTHTAAQAETAAVAEVAQETRERQELARVSRELGMPMDVVKDAAELFRSHVDDCGTDSLVEATLPMVKIGDMFGQRVDEHDKSRRVDFKSFAMAFFCRGFSEGFVLTPEQRELRQLARKNDMECANMDFYKQCFDEFDSDGNGTIDAGEFRALLYRLNKMPEGYSLPDSRVSQLWAEADNNKNGVLDFEEFLHFYRKYYERESGEKCPFTRFYCTARHNSM